ncbi:DMT family transporter [Paenibacillus septentrionalis]|uniref:DMT family transporter n=1 Tax=Paenibacillus septentrionalis TaxID=429342 RepID=A0ABW1V6P5_9BACL
MGYIMLLLATLAWSFVGVLVKTGTTMVDCAILSFARFFFGVLFLAAYLWLRDGKLQLKFGMKWIWIGAIGKAINYVFENIALYIGYSYGNILVQPVQTVVLLLAAAFMFKETITKRSWAAAALCIIGVLIVGWNGVPFAELMQGGGLTTLLFTIAGVGAAVHVLSQRMLIKSMDNGNMNTSIFIVSTLIVTLPIPFQSEGFIGPVTPWAWGALLLLGFITGFSFLWSAEAIKRVPFSFVAIAGNCTVLFAIFWSYLFFNDPITIYLMVGTFVFVAGLLLLNFPLTRHKRVKQINV